MIQFKTYVVSTNPTFGDEAFFDSLDELKDALTKCAELNGWEDFDPEDLTENKDYEYRHSLKDEEQIYFEGNTDEFAQYIADECAKSMVENFFWDELKSLEEDCLSPFVSDFYYAVTGSEPEDWLLEVMTNMTKKNLFE